jgi:uncharacterized RDD family membrane protein YckC
MSDQQTSASNPYQPPKAAISEVATGGAFELAGRGTRLGAILLDGLIGGTLVYAPMFIGGFLPAIVASVVRRQPLVWGPGFALAGGVAGFMSLALGVITFILVKRNGQTIGKKILGIKVVRKDGRKAGVGRIFWLRNVVNALPGFVPLVGGLYGLVDALIIFGQARRCLHDRIADTIVIRA